jgi:murein DD-endopeptidase MepM/ murein hydrolase activator NlpD
LKSYSFHKGLDVSTYRGTVVRAAAAGTVVRTGGRPTDTRGNGVFVEIEHDGLANKNYVLKACSIKMLKRVRKMRTNYFHLRNRAKGIVPGAKVESGQIIGFVNSSGFSTGNHLHFEVRINLPNLPENHFVQIDPRTFVDFPKTSNTIDQKCPEVN